MVNNPFRRGNNNMILNLLSVVEFFSGKKAYIVGLLSIVLGLYYGDREMVMIGLSTITLRAGISKIK